MFRRARISLLGASIAAMLGFTGLLDGSAIIAQAVFFFFMALFVLSFLFGLF